MKALLTGAGGQLATEWAAAAPAGWEVAAFDRAALDIGDPAAVQAVVQRVGPDLILNAAAYTAVDRAESDQSTAWRVNAEGPGHLAAAARAVGARFAHISTDFVFDGRSGRAYRPDDETAPLGAYGASKLGGETAARAAEPEVLIVRTAWVYAAHGANFMKTMLRLMREREEVRVVADQIGTPTSAATLAAALWGLIEARAQGVHHFTDAGVASWYDFAKAISEEGLAAGLLARAPRITPITTADYPTPAPRPAFSVLDKASAWSLLGGPGPHWRDALRSVMAGMTA